jgi:hypothetical protein
MSKELRAAKRDADNPAAHVSFYGFRIARTVPPPRP